MARHQFAFAGSYEIDNPDAVVALLGAGTALLSNDGSETPTPTPEAEAAMVQDVEPEHLVVRGALATIRLHEGAPRMEIEGDAGRVTRKRDLSLGMLAQEAHLDAAFMAAPDLRTAVRSGAAHLDRMAEELAVLEHDRRAGEAVYAELQHRFDILGGYTLDQRVDWHLAHAKACRCRTTLPATIVAEEAV